MLRKALISLIIITSQLIGLSQAYVRVQLYNGAWSEGKLVAVSATDIFLEKGREVISINRKQIEYVLPVSEAAVMQDASVNELPPSSGPVKSKQTVAMQPMDHTVFIESESGLSTLNPFAFRQGLKLWYRVSPVMHVGLGTSFQFYRFGMQNFSGHIRFIGNHEGFFRPFVEGEYGLSVYEHMFQNDWFTRKYDFSPVQQVAVGPGLWMDTGMGIAFVFKVAFCATWFTLEEEFSPTDHLESNYFIGAPLFSGSIIF